ncbi:MAG TPA: tetratricopeptide repeat protein [Terriglobia bacterium]|nr:tetratricopeptide repeat protein [Terriglobia bacterium]
MRIASGLGCVVLAALMTSPAYSQLDSGGIRGKVIDRDGKPIQGAEVRIENQGTHEQNLAKTNKTGDYSFVGLYSGNYKAYLLVNGKPVMVKGEGAGNELAVSGASSLRVNFDMKDAPAAGVVVPGASGSNAKEKAAAEKKANDEMKAAFNAGVAALKASQYEEAVKQFQLAAEKDKTQPAIFGNMGVALTALKKWDEAAEAYRSLLAIKPADAGMQAQLSLALANSGKIDEAMQAADEAGKLDPALAGQSYYNLGAILTNRGKSKEAVEAFKKAIAIDPKNAESQYQLGVAYFGSPDTLPEAVAAFEKYVELKPTGPNAETAKQFIAAGKAQLPARK